MEIVKFKNGTFGVRRRVGLFSKRYQFLSSTRGYWWGINYRAEYCELETKEDAETLMNSAYDVGEPVK